MIYQKSTLGIQEIASSQRSLGVRQRQVLVLINGKRSIEELEGFFEKQQLSDILIALTQGGFVQTLDTPFTTPATQQTSHIFSDTTILLNREQINAIQQILLNGADDYLGIMGRGIKEKIQKTENFEQLRSYISIWHMALRESKLGRESAGFLMEQINQTIGNKTLGEHAPVSQMSH